METLLLKLIQSLQKILNKLSGIIPMWDWVIKEKYMDYALLKSEIQTDPKTLGYAQYIT